jgi:hypothetical protein
MKEFASYIESYFPKHAHKDIALKVIDLFDYVEKNIEEVSQNAENK